MVTFPMIPSPLCQEDRIRKQKIKKQSYNYQNVAPPLELLHVTQGCGLHSVRDFVISLAIVSSHRFKKTHSFSSIPVTRRCQKIPYLLILLHPLKAFPKLNINWPTVKKKKYSPIYKKNILTNAAEMYIALFLARENLYGVEILAVIRGSISSHRSV